MCFYFFHQTTVLLTFLCWFTGDNYHIIILQREATGDVTFKIVPNLRNSEVEEKKVSAQYIAELNSEK